MESNSTSYCANWLASYKDSSQLALGLSFSFNWDGEKLGLVRAYAHVHQLPRTLVIWIFSLFSTPLLFYSVTL